MSIFPTEIYEDIIDFIALGDLYYRGIVNVQYANLRACTLVCRAWYPRAHFHLYKFMDIRNDQALAFFARAARIHFARRLVPAALFIRSHRDNSSKADADAPTPSWVSGVPIRISYPFILLEHLFLENLNFSQIHPKFLPSLTVTRRTVRELHLSGVTFSSLLQFTRLVCLFKKLEHVHLDRSRILNTDTRIPEGPRSRQVSLSALRLWHNDKDTTTKLIEWLEGTSSSLSLQHIVFIYDCMESETCNKLIELGPNATTLEVSYRKTGKDPFKPLSIHNLARLKSLYVSLYHKDNEPVQITKWFFELLVSVSSPTVQTIQVILALDTVDQIDKVPWGDLDDVLVDKKFNGLSVFTLAVGYYEDVTNSDRRTSTSSFRGPVLKALETSMPKTFFNRRNVFRVL